MIDIGYLLSADYLFNMNPGKIVPIYFKYLTPVFVVFIIIGFIFRKLTHKQKLAPDKKLMTKLSNFFIWMGALALLYIFFRQEYVYFFSAPFWMIIWLISFLVWGGFILRYNFKVRPEMIQKIKEKQTKEKYLPKKS